MANRRVYVVLVASLLGHAFCVPVEVSRLKRGQADNELDSSELAVNGIKDQTPESSRVRPARDDNELFGGDSKEDQPSKVGLDATTEKVEYATPVFDSEEDDDDDDFEPMNTAPAGGGSNIFSLLRLANALFPGSNGANPFIRNLLRGYFNNQFQLYPNSPIPYYNGFLRRADVRGNLIDFDEIKGLKPPPERLETFEDDEDDESESEETDSDENNADENNAAEESVEQNDDDDAKDVSKPKSDSQENGNASEEEDYSDEPPEGDGQGGGILGILAGLSGGEDGQSDLGSLLATISGIVANLSGDGFDLNALIASGIGLFVGLLSEGEENPGAVISSYLLTSLDTITGGGSKNNGAFFGTFLSKLIKGTSAGGDPDASSEEGKEPEKDSAGFFGSFLMALLGEMSKGSSGGSSSSHQPEERSLQILWS